MTFQKVKLKDIAKALRLSESTVSKALRDSHEISAATKERVQKQARKVNYRINHNASNLRSLRSFLIGVLVPDIKTDFMAQAISGINSVAQRNSSLVIMSETSYSHLKELKQLGNLVSRSIDGLIMSPSCFGANNVYLKELLKREMPMVILNDVSPDINTCKVISNDYQCLFDGINRLINEGYKKFAYVSNAEQTSVNKERLKGFEDALSFRGINVSYKMTLIENKKTSAYDFESQLTRLLMNPDGPEVVVAGNELTSTIVLKVLSSLDVHGSKIKMLGVSSSEIAELFTPNISYLKQPAYEMGQVAAEMLFDIINNDKPETYKTVKLDSIISWNLDSPLLQMQV